VKAQGKGFIVEFKEFGVKPEKKWYGDFLKYHERRKRPGGGASLKALSSPPPAVAQVRLP
jgi:hypothetical protein